MKLLIALSLLLSAPAFANENGTCYGGPGMYPYPCPKPAKPETCYGGPGMYPFPCPPRR